MKQVFQILTLLLFFGQIGNTQNAKVQELLKNPDITWAAEGFSMCNPDKSYSENKAAGFISRGEFVKFISSPIEGTRDLYPLEAGNNHQLNARLLTHRFLEKNKVYSDKELTQEIATAEKSKMLNTVDTIVTLDTKTFTEKKVAVVNEFNPDDVKGYRIHQIIYYHKKDTQFYALPLSIAPVVHVLNDTGAIVGEKTLYWVSVDEIFKTDITNPNHDWIKRMAYHFAFDEKEMKLLKSTQSLEQAFDTFIQDIRKAAKKQPVYNVYTTLGEQRLSVKQTESLLNSTDTIITFDPVTFKESVQTRVNNLTIKDMEGLRLVQDWVWDSKTQRLSIRFLGIAVIMRHYDDAGNFLFSGPIFYRRDKNLK